MRSPMIVLAVLALTSACAHEERAESSTPESRSLATTPPASGGEVANACGEAQVFFQPGSSELDADARARLDTYAGCLSRHETDAIYVSGMTDPEGTPEENLVLGRARARATADYLHAAGCNVDFVIRTYGESGALASEPLWPLERSATAAAVATP